MTRRYLTAATVETLAQRLSAPDWAVLHRVSDLRFVTGDQLTRLCFWDVADTKIARERAARRALLRLVERGVLARLPRAVGGIRSGSAGFTYYLDAGGERLAARQGWQPERRRRRPHVPGTLFIRHTLDVAELHTQLVEAGRSGRFELLELSAEPSCWRPMDGLDRQRAFLKPDSFVSFAAGEYEYSRYIELDRATEGSRAVRRQMEAYLSYRASGREQSEAGYFPGVVWLTTGGPARVRMLADCVNGLPVQGRDVFSVAELGDWSAAVLPRESTQ